MKSGDEGKNYHQDHTEWCLLLTPPGCLIENVLQEGKGPHNSDQ